MQNDKIVCIADVIMNLQCSFEKLVKFVHVDINKELACQIPKW